MIFISFHDTFEGFVDVYGLKMCGTQEKKHIPTCFAVVTAVAIDTGAVVLVHHIGASSTILTWVVCTIVNVYNILKIF